MSRKKIEIDWNVVDEKLSNFCEGTEIAEHLGIHKETLYDAVKKKYKTDFSDYKAQKRAKGEMILRELQMKSAKEGNITMQIWLGKQYLNQTDKADYTSKGESLRPLEISVDSSEIKDELNKLINGEMETDTGISEK
ncbi:hypothetical protein ES705_19846 [subsurface metagenome]